jgi:hypothetical protein
MVVASVIAAKEGGLADVVIGLAGVVFFGFGAWSFLTRGLSREAALVIDALAFHDNASAPRAGRVTWEEVGKVGLRGSVLYVLPRTEGVITRQSAPKRLIMRLSAATVGAPINIPTWLLAVPKERIASYIDAIADARGT